jgi:hypothetical protein
MLYELEPVANFGFARRFELSPPLGFFLGFFTRSARLRIGQARLDVKRVIEAAA